MMVRECMSSCYVLFWIVVVPASDPKYLFMERVTMFTAQSTGLVWGRRTGCDCLDLGNGVGLSPSLGTRGGLCRI
jgi:hypothetical protein